MNKYRFLIISVLFAIILLFGTIGIIDMGSIYMLVVSIIYFVFFIIQIITAKKSQNNNRGL